MEAHVKRARFEHLYAQYGQLYADDLTIAAAAVRDQIIAEHVTPDRVDYLGNTHTTTFDEYNANHWPTVAGRPSCSRVSHSLPVQLARRQLGGRRRRPSTVISTRFVAERTKLNKNILGHLSQTYCVVFDRTGENVLTGSDDFLVKAWSVHTCRLRFTFRGCDSPITDLNVSRDNALVAACSYDCDIRVWSLTDGHPVALVPDHMDLTSCLYFLPVHTLHRRTLVSTGDDGVVIFTRVDNDDWERGLRQTRCAGLGDPSIKLLTSAHSPGGRVVAVGASDGRLRIYLLDDDEPRRVFDQQVHANVLDSLTWSSTLTFASASRDGVAKVWRMGDGGEWRDVSINVSKFGKLRAMRALVARDQLPRMRSHARGEEAPMQIGMIAFADDDTLLCVSLSDYGIYVCCATTGALMRVFSGMSDTTLVLERHPINGSILMAVSSDGHLVMWDSRSGARLFDYNNLVPGEGHASLYDARISPDGTSTVAVDANGCLLIFGTIERAPNHAHATPDQQFFHTDYRPTTNKKLRDVLDEQTMTMPHLMRPPTLVDMHGTAHGEHCQRFVPGRESTEASVVAASRARPSMGANAQPGSAAIEQALMHHLEQQNARRAVVQAPPVVAPLGVSVWSLSDRFIVHPLDDAELRTAITRSVTLGTHELHEHSVSKQQAPPPKPETSNSSSPPRVRRRRTVEDIEAEYARRYAVNRPASNAVGRTNRRDRRNAGLAVAEDDADRVPMLGYHPASASDSNDTDDRAADESSMSDTSDTDYDVAETRPRAVTGERRPRRAARDVDDDGDDVEDGEDADGRVTPPVTDGRRGRRPRAPRTHDEDDDDDEEVTEQQPSTSSRGRQRKPIKRATVLDDEASFDGAVMPEWQRSFPRWVTMGESRLTPYSPQTLDEIVVVRDAYVAYLERIRRGKLFNVRTNAWPTPDFREVEYARVDRVQYVMKPYRAAKLHLAQLNHLTGAPTGIFYSLLYADLDDQADFVLLKQHYAAAMQQRLVDGTRVIALMEDRWYGGRVTTENASTSTAPSGIYNTLTVTWDDGDKSPCSPWDVRLDDGQLLEERTDDDDEVRAATRDHHLAMAAYAHSTDEYPTDRGITRTRILTAVDECIALERFVDYRVDVPLDVYPNYSAVVPYAMHLNTIRERLMNDFYRRVSAIEQDVQLMLLNALLYNEENSNVVSTARVLVETLLRYISADTLGVTLTETLEVVLELSADEMTKCTAVLDDDQAVRKSKITGASSVHVSSTQWRVDCAYLVSEAMKTSIAKPFMREGGTHVEMFQADDELLSLDEMLAKLLQRVDSYATPADVREDVVRVTNAARAIADTRREPLHVNAGKLKSSLGDSLARLHAEYLERLAATAAAGGNRATPDHVRMSRHGRPLKQVVVYDPDDDDEDDDADRCRRRVTIRKSRSRPSSRRQRRAIDAHAMMDEDMPSTSRTSSLRERRAVVHYDDDEEDDAERVPIVRQRESREARAHRRQASSASPSEVAVAPPRRKRARVLDDDEDDEDGVARRTLRSRNRTAIHDV